MSEEAVTKKKEEAKEAAPAAAKAKKAPAAKSAKKSETPAAKAAKKDEAPAKAPEEKGADSENKEPAAPVTEEQRTRDEAAAILNLGGDDVAAKAKSAESDADKKKGRVKSIPAGICFIRSTFNNTQVSITDARGGVIAWSSAGKAGFKGSRKCTAFAATMVAQDAARQAISKGMHEVEVKVQGAGAGRESAVRAIQTAGMHVTVLKDCTPIPHNGCRPRKRRRV